MSTSPWHVSAASGLDVYKNYIASALPGGSATIIQLPPAPPSEFRTPQRIEVQYSAYAPSTTTWNLSLTFGGVTLSSVTLTATQYFDRTLSMVADPANNLVYVTIDNKKELTVTPVAFSNWDVTNAATLSITPNINATLISVRDTQYK